MDQEVLVLPEEDDGVRVITCSGAFDQATLEPLRRACAPALADPAVRRIVLDVSRVTFADSSMLNTMLRLLRTSSLVLAGPLPRTLARVLELTQADRLFPTADGMREARTL
ncbi:STAS domain-containing protein [Streptomyces antarcticus]|uniref:STAS domain-containing protein n=1 Tax=Streptomyces antarcticus TaxID=2996458 RepID=UPI00226FF5E7|nr:MULTISPECIES: STAS domain-containing protein [unclassified Streptomyces]MCY0944835.1 STAS domain-containing protein [Streptomyces sp. H34-AA3]MCZ4081132.1 STAS domain-containing protein [Streptomyces sp. H34-S5]